MTFHSKRRKKMKISSSSLIPTLYVVGSPSCVARINCPGFLDQAVLPLIRGTSC